MQRWGPGPACVEEQADNKSCRYSSVTWCTFSRSLYRSLMVNSSCLDRLKWLSTRLVRMLDSFDMIISLSTCQSSQTCSVSMQINLLHALGMLVSRDAAVV